MTNSCLCRNFLRCCGTNVTKCDRRPVHNSTDGRTRQLRLQALGPGARRHRRMASMPPWPKRLRLLHFARHLKVRRADLRLQRGGTNDPNSFRRAPGPSPPPRHVWRLAGRALRRLRTTAGTSGRLCPSCSSTTPILLPPGPSRKRSWGRRDSRSSRRLAIAQLSGPSMTRATNWGAFSAAASGPASASRASSSSPTPKSAS